MISRIIIGSASLVLALPALAQAPSNSQAANITRAEVLAELKTAFGRVDVNKDGAISVAEANSAQQRVAAERAAEIAKNAATQFAQLDTDKNGQLSLAEFKAAAPSVRVATGEQIIKLLDANKDGKISPAEFEAQRLRAFDSVDTNHDGTVTPAERQAASGGTR